MLRIFSPCCNRPTFIEKQVASFKHFMQDEFEFIVINDGPNEFLKNKIFEECQKLDIRCIETPDNGFNRSGPSWAHASVLNWVYHDVILKEYTDDIVFFVDSDLFMVKGYSVVKSLGDNNFAALPQRRGHIKYYQPNMMILNMATLPNPDQFNLNPAMIEGHATDIGGSMYYYVKNNPGLKINNLVHTSHITPENKNMHVIPGEAGRHYDPDYNIEFYEGSFLHYGAATNWKISLLSSADFMPSKTWFVFNFIDNCMSGKIELDIDFVFKE